MKHILLLYATMEGQTEKIANKINANLGTEGCMVTMVNVSKPEQIKAIDPSDFDLLVFGASVHIGKIEKPMIAFINHHVDSIKTKPRSLFVVLMAAASSDPTSRAKSLADISQYLDKTLQVSFANKEMIAGAIKYTQYNWFIKWVMKQITKKEGGSTDTSRDHEYTDWDQVVQYAKRLASM